MEKSNKEIKENVEGIRRILEKNPNLYDSLSPLRRRVVEALIKKDLDKAGRGG